MSLQAVTVPLIVGADSGVNEMLDRDARARRSGFHMLAANSGRSARPWQVMFMATGASFTPDGGWSAR